MTINLKALPQNNEAEQAVLGSILIDQDAMNLALEEIVESDFYDENHKKIFSAMVDLDKESKPIELLLISSSESQKFNGSINIPKGSPEENPKNRTIKSLGCR